MGFWKAAGKLAAEVAKDALSSAREVKAIHDRTEDKSSAELRKITTDDGFFSSTTITEKRPARSILRNRDDR
jgi:hypothetical protein